MAAAAAAAAATTTSGAPEIIDPESLPHVPTRTRKTFITSDLHFFHTKIIKYCKRPYQVEGWENNNPVNDSAISQMNEDILKLFDKLPLDCDIWNLGDIFCFRSKKYEETPERIQMAQNFVSRMKGEGDRRRLFLVLGNHDRGQPGKSIIDFYLNLGFDQVYDTPVVLENRYILSHKPMFIKKGSPMINLHGHLHDQILHKDDFCIDYSRYSKLLKRVMRGEAEKPELEISWPEREIDLANYRNMCIDYNKGILEWSDDFSTAVPIWNK